ncbi:MAG: carboxypeptidase regulatory-like domain-containing protein, partial [Terriglobia bacterium]
KSIDTVSSMVDMNGAITVIDPYNVNAYRSVSDFNVPQNFVLNYFWQLPSPQHGLAKRLLGGWSTTGIWTWQSGFPLDINSGSDTSYSLGESNVYGYDQAQQIAPWQYTTGSRGQRVREWFTTNAFAKPLPNSFGNVGRNTLIGPGTFNVDFAIHRTFSLSERFKLQYRAELFNLLNNTQLNNPATELIDRTFGQITSARDPRIIQMALKLTF